MLLYGFLDIITSGENEDVLDKFLFNIFIKSLAVK